MTKKRQKRCRENESFLQVVDVRCIMCLSLASWRFRSLRSRNGAHSRMRGKGKQGRRAVRSVAGNRFSPPLFFPFLPPRRTTIPPTPGGGTSTKNTTMLRIMETELSPLTGLWREPFRPRISMNPRRSTELRIWVFWNPCS